MSLIYKALENAKSQGADLATEQQTQQPDLAKQSLFRSITMTQRALGVTVLATGSALMLANAGQFASSGNQALSVSAQTETKNLAKSTSTDSDVSAAIDGTDANTPVSAMREPNAATEVEHHSAETKVKPIVVAEPSTPAATLVAAPPRQETVVEIKTPAPRQEATFETKVQPQNIATEKPRKPGIRSAYTGTDNSAQQQSSRVVMHIKHPYAGLYSSGTGNANNTQKHDSVEHIIVGAKQAIRSKDFVTAEIKLHSLGDIAGTESMVYKRISAYYLLSKGDKEAAALAYHGIVEMAPNDLEAGYNLALLEVQLGRMEQARSRIRFLKEAFPQSSAIDKLAELIKN